ncbi:MAG: isoprenylcysteine carboxyl methyltransferase [Propionibacteriales bacterium]|nr:isoprenylcysteine carboxyl methyltransferase [Propionibacteriales bacterium]
MQRRGAAVISAIWFVLAPGVVAGLVPWLLTAWEVRNLPAYWMPVRLIGGLAVLAGVAVLAHSFVRFVVEGFGTPVPVAPTRRLVVGGLYRYVRNPMYVAVLAAIGGQVLVLGQLQLLVYGAVVAVVVAAFVHGYEEPALRRRFGEEYAEYRRAVPAWRPRSRPWAPR